MEVAGDANKEDESKQQQEIEMTAQARPKYKSSFYDLQTTEKHKFSKVF